MGSVLCVNCAGSGEPGPFEYDHWIWYKGEALAVCGVCHGAGHMSRFGFRLKALKIGTARRMMALAHGEVT